MDSVWPGLAYALASKLRAEFTGRLNRMLADVDCSICPSMANAAHVKSVDQPLTRKGVEAASS
jgi:hypothetical protein